MVIGIFACVVKAGAVYGIAKLVFEMHLPGEKLGPYYCRCFRPVASTGVGE